MGVGVVHIIFWGTHKSIARKAHMTSLSMPSRPKWLFEYWQFVKLERTVFTLLLWVPVVGSSLGFGQYIATGGRGL